MNIVESKTILGYLNVYKDIISSLKEFVDSYKNIIDNDKKQPLFSLTTKYGNFPKKKFERMSKPAVIPKSKNAWKVLSTDEKNKMNIIIKETLNKLTDKNYDSLSEELITKIKPFDDIELFYKLSKEILDKSIYDTEYHNIYIKLCKKIWDNNEIKNNLIKIVEKDRKYYIIGENSNNKINLYGQFENIQELSEFVNSNFDFKSILLNTYQREFYKKIEYFSNIKDSVLNDEVYKIRKKISSISEFICKMYLNNYITINVIDNLFYNLCCSDTIYKEDVEIVYNLLRYLNSDNYNNLYYFIKYLKNNYEENMYDSRTKFFLDEIVNKVVKDTRRSIENTKNAKSVDSNNVVSNDEIEGILQKYIKDKTDLPSTVNVLRNYEDLTSVIIYSILEDISNVNKYVTLLGELYSKKIILRKNIIFVFNGIVEQYDDIKVDVPNISSYLPLIINKLSKRIGVTFCNNKFIIYILDHIKDKDELYSISHQLINNCEKISQSAMEKLFKTVAKNKKGMFFKKHLNV